MKRRSTLLPETKATKKARTDLIESPTEAKEFVRWLFKDHQSPFPKIRQELAIAVARLLATKVAGVHRDPEACQALASNLCRLVLLFEPKPIATLAKAKQFLDTLPRFYKLAGMTWSADLSGFLDGIDQRTLDETVFHRAEVSSVYVGESTAPIYFPRTIRVDVSMKLAVAHVVLTQAGVPKPYPVIVRLARDCGLLQETYGTIQHVHSRINHIRQQVERTENDSGSRTRKPSANHGDPRIMAKFWVDLFYQMRGIL